ncbi:HlyD family efflux transporter periplasmic adaptor subunit [Sorangium sp. So ce1036]|uniref:efflux RND transporter periplasmic adaptor subunit n=1 Tax=Sorangium sp. So ce1036 TaxID=3133328 RepID=UPI003EFE7E33
MTIARKILYAVLAALLVGAIALASLPKPALVEASAVTRGPLVVTVDGDGRTRIKDRFVISAPVSGQMPRLELHPGDRVARGAALVEIAPIDPPLLDARSRAQAEAHARSARAGVSQVKARVALAETSLAQARVELARVRTLHERGGVPQAELEAAEFRERAAQAELESAKFGARVAQYELQTAEAALVRMRPAAPGAPARRAGGGDGSVALESPVDGTVLRVFQESATLLQAGAPILELGDPGALEIVIDLLSADAVAVKPGAEVRVERWGGEAPLEARVRLVEPSGFTKVSALGVEEQRVNVIADFSGPPEARAALGDGYRVYARVVVWQKADVIKAPQTALFRRGDRWAVFVLADGRAHLREVEIGKRSGSDAEVLAGLGEGDRVVVHPSDTLEDGARVEVR